MLKILPQFWEGVAEDPIVCLEAAIAITAMFLLIWLKMINAGLSLQEMEFEALQHQNLEIE